MKNPIKAYVDAMHHSVKPPNWYDRIVHLEIPIKKGATSGTVVIPCAIETLSHSIDLNPSLVRKKGKKLIIHVEVDEDFKFIEDPNIKDYEVDSDAKTIRFNPQDYIIYLSKGEKKRGVYLSEIHRCEHCNRKEFIAKVKETRYKSCPSVEVKLSDPASEDVVVPVDFGLSTIDATGRTINALTLPALVIAASYFMIFRQETSWWQFGLLGVLWLMAIPQLYRSIRLMKWWWENRLNMTHIYTEPTWRKWVRGVFTI